jgi:hypothetical protein
MTDRDLLDELRHEWQIRQALLRYCRGLDRKEFDLVRSAYHVDAFDNHGAYKGDIDGLIAWMQQRHQQVEQCLHSISNCVIERVGDAAVVETYLTTFQRYRLPADADGAEPKREQVLAAVRFIDRFERRSAEWKVAHRTVVFESNLISPAGPQLPDGWTQPKRDHSDVLWPARASVLIGPDGGNEQ